MPGPRKNPRCRESCHSRLLASTCVGASAAVPAHVSHVAFHQSGNVPFGPRREFAAGAATSMYGTIMNPRPQASANDAPGFAARRVAAEILDGVLRRARPLDEQLDGKGANVGLAHLADRDRALVRRIVATVLRRLGSLRHVVGGFLERGLPRDAARAETALLIGAAQILLLGGPAHAAVDLSVRIAQADRHAARYAGLINAVLR